MIMCTRRTCVCDYVVHVCGHQANSMLMCTHMYQHTWGEHRSMYTPVHLFTGVLVCSPGPCSCLYTCMYRWLLR